MGMLCFCFSQLSRFKHIEWFGFKAELWDTTQQKAEVLTRQLTKQQAQLGKLQIDLLSRVGCFDSAYSRREQYEYFSTLLENSKESSDVQKEIKEAFCKVILKWYLHGLAGEIAKPLDAFKTTLNQTKEALPEDAAHEEIDRKEKAISQLQTTISSVYSNLNEMDSFKKNGLRAVEKLEHLISQADELTGSSSYSHTSEPLVTFVKTGHFEDMPWFEKLLDES